MSFRDWLDVGWVFLTKDASTPVRKCLQRLASAETVEDVERGFDALNAVMESERAARDKYEREQRKASGTVSLIDEREAQSAADMFNAARQGHVDDSG